MGGGKEGVCGGVPGLLYAHTVLLYVHAVLLHAHTVLLYAHTVLLYAHTVLLYAHTVLLYAHTVLLYTRTVLLYTHTVLLYTHTVLLYAYTLLGGGATHADPASCATCAPPLPAPLQSGLAQGEVGVRPRHHALLACKRLESELRGQQQRGLGQEEGAVGEGAASATAAGPSPPVGPCDVWDVDVVEEARRVLATCRGYLHKATSVQQRQQLKKKRPARHAFPATNGHSTPGGDLDLDLVSEPDMDLDPETSAHLSSGLSVFGLRKVYPATAATAATAAAAAPLHARALAWLAGLVLQPLRAARRCCGRPVAELGAAAAPPPAAVEGLWLGVPAGQCLCLLVRRSSGATGYGFRVQGSWGLGVGR